MKKGIQAVAIILFCVLVVMVSWGEECVFSEVNEENGSDMSESQAEQTTEPDYLVTEKTSETEGTKLSQEDMHETEPDEVNGDGTEYNETEYNETKSDEADTVVVDPSSRLTYWTLPLYDWGYEVSLKDLVPEQSLQIVVNESGIDEGEEKTVATYEVGVDYTTPEDIWVVTFDNLLGHEGICVYRSFYPCYNYAEYYAIEEKEDDIETFQIAYTWGNRDTREQEDYMVDLDGDGDRELVGTVQWFADGAQQTLVYKWENGCVLQASAEDMLDEPYDNNGAYCLYSEYLPESNQVCIHYWQDELDDYKEKDYPIDWEVLAKSENTQVYCEIEQEELSETENDETDEWEEEEPYHYEVRSRLPMSTLGEERKKSFGKILPYLREGEENSFAQAVRNAKEYEHMYRAYTYCADYDGNGTEEAFVLMASNEKSWYRYLQGDLWFVDEKGEAVCLEKNFESFQEQYFLCDGENIYLFVEQDYKKQIYTVEDGKPIQLLSEPEQLYLDERGLVCIQRVPDYHVVWKEEYKEMYEGDCNCGVIVMKHYPFVLENCKLTEVPAREVTREEVEEIAPLPDGFDEYGENCEKQFILRENGDLDINMANIGDEGICFLYRTYHLMEENAWEYVEDGEGIWRVQMDVNSCEEYANRILQAAGI